MKVLAADLDGTLLGGDATDRRRLRAVLARHSEVTVVFATGRGLPAVREALRDPLLPRPRWIIADIGATVLDGADLSPVEPLKPSCALAGPVHRVPSRSVHLLGTTTNPDGRWTIQQIRNLVMDLAVTSPSSGSSSETGPASSPRRATLSWPM